MGLTVENSKIPKNCKDSYSNSIPITSENVYYAGKEGVK